MAAESNHVKSVQKTTDIVEALQDLHVAGVTELANRLDMPKSSVYNYLQSLAATGYVTADDGRYRLSLRFLDLGAHTRNQERIYEAGRDEVDNLAEETDELVNILVEEQGRGVYIYRSSGDRDVPVDTRIGKRAHLTTTALGKAILAQYPRSDVEEIVDEHGLPRRTENTITDREVLFEELEIIAETDIAFDREERLEGIKCIATTIHGNDGQVLGAISVSGPAHRMKGQRYEEDLPEQILQAANMIELKAKYS